MATSSWGTNAPEAVKLWGRKLFREALKATWIYKFMGNDSNSLIQIQDDTQKGPGDRVRVTLRMLLSGNGIQGDGTLEGNEEALTTYTDNVTIDQLRHAVRSGGRMSEQRIPFEVREEARMALTDWWADRLDTWFFQQMCGNSLQTDTRFTGNQAATQPDANSIVLFNGLHATEASLNSASAATANPMRLRHIDRLVMVAKTKSPQVRPIKINGRDHYVLFLHPEQVYDLRNEELSITGAAQTRNIWPEIQQAAMRGGDITENPIFTGALGMYNNVILHESTRITHAVSGSSLSNVRRAVFCGAQAACLAFGQGYGDKQMDWTEELFDYQNQLGVSAGLIAGLKKTVFNSADFASIVAPTGVTINS